MKIKKENVKVVLKGTTMLVVGIAASVTTAAVIKNIIPISELTKINKALVAIGGAAIGGVVGNAGANYAGETVDELFDGITGIELIFKGLTWKKDEENEENKEIVPV